MATGVLLRKAGELSCRSQTQSICPRLIAYPAPSRTRASSLSPSRGGSSRFFANCRRSVGPGLPGSPPLPPEGAWREPPLFRLRNHEVPSLFLPRGWGRASHRRRQCAYACAFVGARGRAQGPPDPGDPHFPGGCGDATGASIHFPPVLSPQAVFAQLVARDVQLKEGPLRWYSDPGLAGVFLGPGLSYDQRTRELMVAEPGLYYVFLHLKLQRVMSSTGSGSVSAALHLQPLGTEAAALDLTLDLPPPSSEAHDSAAGFRGSLLHLDAGQRLRVHLRAEAGAHPAWQLAQGATILGLFRVATKVPTGLPSSWPMDTGPGSPPLDGE
nr:tumor necrosis factor ligand superfamily member 9 [Vulpes vulpes]